jgi:hypothetical protein
MRRQDALWARIGRDGISRVIQEEERSHRVNDMDLARLHPELSPYTVGDMRRGDHQPTFESLAKVVEALSRLDSFKARYGSWLRLADAIRPTRTPRRVLRRLTLIGAALTVALSLMTQTALAGTADYGPGQTGVGAASPAYSIPIPVIDTLAPTLNLEHRRIWRQARNAALANWSTGCVSFTVTTGYATWDDSVGILGFANLVTPGAITLFNNQSSYPQEMGGYDVATGAGLATYHPWKPWWKSYYRSQLEGVIGHEIGHALGFGHGGNGIMAGQTERPNTTDLALLRSYYC